MLDHSSVSVFTDRDTATDKVVQQFEIHLESSSDLFEYRLEIEHDLASKLSRVSLEHLKMNGKPLIEAKKGEARLYRDDHTQGPNVLVDWTLSTVGFMNERPDNKNLIRFRQELSRIIILRPNPFDIEKFSSAPSKTLDWQGKNFVSWFQWISQEYIQKTPEIFSELKNIFNGFSHLRILGSGEEVQTLKLVFKDPKKELGFEVLSEGQRILCILYTLLFCPDDNISIFIDEPDNFIALREIQPWIQAIDDQLGDRLKQIAIISHHPEFLDGTHSSNTIYFYLDGTHSRTKEFKPHPPLSPSETLARGWES